MYYTVEVDGETRAWLSLEYAMTDLFSRGFESAEWTFSKHDGDPS
jgi:hypothetical protein